MVETILGVNPGFIQLAGASLNAPAGGLTFVANQGLIGIGAISSHVVGSASDHPRTAVVTLAGSQSSVENVSVSVGAKDCVCIRVTVANTFGGTGDSNEDSRLTNIFCNDQQDNAIAFAIGDNVVDTSRGDVSEVVLIGCDSVGKNSADTGSTHIQVGNGGTGNAGDVTNIGGNSQFNKYGVVIAGGWLVSRGLNFEWSGVADIWLYQPGVGNVSFEGGRSENAARFVATGHHAFVTYGTVKFADYTVFALKNTDGQGVQLGWPATFENVLISGQFVPQYFFLAGPGVDNDNPAILTAQSCVSDHPYPFQTNWSRPGKIIRSSGTRFAGDTQFQFWSCGTTSDRWVRRMNVTSPARFTINPFFYDAIDINLAGSGTGSGVDAPIILPGAVGQTITICYQEDGVGGFPYAWPALCAFSGGSAPTNVTTPHNRQSATFRYNGRYWEQTGPVTNVLPPAVAATPIVDNFSTQVLGGTSFWLNQPDTLPVPSPTGPRWEHVPGGGSLGINNGPPSRCVTLCVGYVGDNNTDDGRGLAGSGAAAVIETGMATQPAGISATFTWQTTEGIVAHYLDDQTFALVYLSATDIIIRGWSHGVPIASAANFAHGLTTVTPGSTHTLLVQCTNTAGIAGFNINLDAGAFTRSLSFSPIDSANLGSFAKHGIFSSSGAERSSLTPPGQPATFTNFTVK